MPLVLVSFVSPPHQPSTRSFASDKVRPHDSTTRTYRHMCTCRAYLTSALSTSYWTNDLLFSRTHDDPPTRRLTALSAVNDRSRALAPTNSRAHLQCTILVISCAPHLCDAPPLDNSYISQRQPFVHTCAPHSRHAHLRASPRLHANTKSVATVILRRAMMRRVVTIPHVAYAYLHASPVHSHTSASNLCARLHPHSDSPAHPSRESKPH